MNLFSRTQHLRVSNKQKINVDEVIITEGKSSDFSFFFWSQTRQVAEAEVTEPGAVLTS